MALSYSCILRVPLSYSPVDTNNAIISTQEFGQSGSGPFTDIVDALTFEKTFYEGNYGGTYSWVITTDATYTYYTISWTGLTLDPNIDPAADAFFYGNPVSFLFTDITLGDIFAFAYIYSTICQELGECPECPPSVNPEDATDCPDCFSDEVPFCDTPITVLGLEASTEYDFKIQDQATGRIYTYTTTTDINGEADLTVADFPTGLFTPYNGPFTITIFDTNGDPVVLTYGYVNYSCLEVTITNSTDYTP